MRRATVVLPVPGLPVKLMCSDGPRARPARPRARSRSITSSAAISRMRVLTGASATRSSSSCGEHVLDPPRPATAAAVELRPCVIAPPPFVVRPAVGRVAAADRRPSVAYGVERVADLAVGLLRALEPEAGLVRRPADDERQRRRLAPERAVVGDDLHVVVAGSASRAARTSRSATSASSSVEVEHRLAPHLPVARCAGAGRRCARP